MGFDFLTNKKLLKLESFVSIYNLIIEVIAEFNKRHIDAEKGIEEMLPFLEEEFKQIDIDVLENVKKIYSGCTYCEGGVIYVGISLCGIATFLIEQAKINQVVAKSAKKPESLFFASNGSKSSVRKIEGTITEPHEFLEDLIQFAMYLLDKKDALNINLGVVLLAVAMAFQHAIIEESVGLIKSNFNRFFSTLNSNELKNLDNDLKETAKKIVINTTEKLIPYLQENLPEINPPASKCIIS